MLASGVGPFEVGGATVEVHFSGPVRGAHRLMVVDDEGDVVLEVLDRLNTPRVRVAKMRDLLLEHGFLRPGDDRLHTLFG